MQGIHIFQVAQNVHLDLCWKDVEMFPIWNVLQGGVEIVPKFSDHIEIFILDLSIFKEVKHLPHLLHDALLGVVIQTKDPNSLSLSLCRNVTLSLVPNFSTVLSDVRSSPEHALVPNNAHSEVVHGNTMGLLAHHLWGHVPRSTRSVFRIFGVPDPRNTQISYLEITILIKN